VIGKTLAHYKIIEKIGAGGMGEVYRATDTKLGRDVALKLLPPAFAENAERMARFEREARLLASLNHPGIASIFGIEHDGGLHFLAMELADGDDLAQRLAGGPLPVQETLGLVQQIAEALEEAHGRGIVHRDLKPANIRVASNGKVKILDFGLAKALDDGPAESEPENSPTIAPEMTRAGVILGTAAYMSPEQARGELADTRTDIWAFGCVLWECLTGKTLFGGRTASDSIGAILRDEPNWNELPADVPAHVHRLLRRCLVKDSSKRLHHIADVRIELEAPVTTDQGLTADAVPAAPGASSRLRSTAYLLVGLLAGALAMLLVHRIGLFGTTGETGDPLAGNHLAKLTKLTDFPGDEFDAAVSPDGRFVAFVSDRDGPYDVLVGQIDSREFRNVTRDSDESSLQKDVRAVRSVGFTGDGTEVWFGGGTGQRLMTMPLLGGSARNFLGETVVNVEWSPSRNRIVYHLSGPGDPVYVADPTGANEALILPSEAGHHQHYPIWSPDDQWIYLVRGRPITGEMDLWRMRPAGDGLERLTKDMRNVAYPTPIDGRTVLFCAEEPDGAGPWLWSLDVETRVSRRVTLGVEQYSSVSASADGRRVVATVENPQAALWRVPILDRVATESDAVPFPMPTVRALAPRLGHDQLFYLSSRGAGDGLWRYRNGESEEIWKGAETALLVPPAVSPDGRVVALVLRREAGQRLHLLSADGAELQALTDRVDVRGCASWSPDGRWLVVGGIESGSDGLFKIPVDGDSPVRIADGEALNPVWSPNGDLIVYTGRQVRALSPLLGLRPDGAPVELPPIQVLREGGGERVRFLPDGRGLVYMQGLSPSQDFFLLDLASMESRRLTRLEDPATMRTFDIVPNGSEIVFDRLRRNSDLVLIDFESSSP
jgi:Tol biopolymer transport system component